MAQNNEKISIVARELSEKGVLKTYSSYIPSFVLSRSVDFLSIVIDSWILAHLLGPTSLGVTSRVQPLCQWGSFIFSLFDGFHTYISHSFGENNLHKVNTLFTFSSCLMLLFSALLTLLYCYSPTILYLLEGTNMSSHYLVKLSHRYLLGMSWGTFPMIALSALSYLVRIDGSKYLPIYASSAVIICNIILDFLLIGSFRYFGAGLATSISYWIGFFILCIHFLKKTNTYRLLTTFDFSEISFKKIISLTYPRLAHQTAKLCNVSILTFLGFRGFGIVFGTVNTIYNIVHEFIHIALVGVINAARPLIGIVYGQKDYKTLRKILHAMYALTLLSAGSLCLFSFIFPQLIPLLMNLHPYDEAFVPACNAIRLLAINSMIYALNFIYIMYYQQVGHEKFVSIINLLKPTIFVIPFFYLLAHTANPNGFWWANIYRELITLVILFTFHLWQNYKLKDKYLGA